MMTGRSYISTCVALIVAACMIGACNGDKGTKTISESPADTAQLAPPATTPAQTAEPVAIDTSGPVVTHTATISTTAGEIVVALFGKDAPKTVENFVGLAKKNYYDGVAFHRVVPGFMVQTGDPNSRDETKRPLWGQGGESIFGKTFADELDTATKAAKLGYSDGVVAMANSGPNTNGSQFFIVLTTQGARHLKFNYTIFGRVLQGMEVVHKIENTGLQGEQPMQPAHITAVTVKEVTS
jgi:cyclophilin family peptidyl-prolyl cis-trans isomerase